MIGNRIQRAMVIEGVATPAFIHNGPTYFFINLPVYADGLIDAWEMVDLPLFEEKIARGWVDTAVPDGQQVSVHGLTSFTVEAGRWEISPADLVIRVRALLKELNPELRNLYDCHGETTKQVGKVRVSILGTAAQVPIREGESRWSRRLRGDNASVLLREGGRIYLADLRVFEDGLIELGRVPTPRLVSVDELSAAARDGALLSEVSPGERVEILGLGSFAVREQYAYAEVAEILKSVPDMIDRVNGRPDSVARCRAAFEAYLRDPTVAAREALRAAYEGVPEHERMYVGDMDTKDVAVRMILYGEQEIETWSHWAVAQGRGDPLPAIDVPVPRPEPVYVEAVRVDLAPADGWGGLHDAFTTALGFPDFYGRNMDAWIDCMTSLDDPPAGMTAVHVEPGQVLVIELTGIDAFAARCPEPYAALLECAAFVNYRRREVGQPAVLALSFKR